MLENATIFVNGAITAIGSLLDPGGSGTSDTIGWAALLALSVSGAVIGTAVAVLRKFSRRK